jgi:RNA polymerase sigma factor FliA
MHPQSADRNELIERYRSYAQALAAEFIRNIPAQVEKDDIFGYAELGLVEAATTFDPANGVHFKTFSYYRIRGAIYDGLRKLGGLPREFYRQLKAEGAATAYLEDYATQTSKVPGSEQYQEIRTMCANVVSTYILSLDAAGTERADSGERSPDELLRCSETSRLVHDAIDQLPEKNRRVVVDYYFKDLSLEEIGKSMGLSKSWVCRLHARSIDLLRSAFLPPAPVAHEATMVRAAR